MDRSDKHYVGEKKPDTEEHIIYIKFKNRQKQMDDDGSSQ